MAYAEAGARVGVALAVGVGEGVALALGVGVRVCVVTTRNLSVPPQPASSKTTSKLRLAQRSLFCIIASCGKKWGQVPAIDGGNLAPRSARSGQDVYSRRPCQGVRQSSFARGRSLLHDNRQAILLCCSAGPDDAQDIGGSLHRTYLNRALACDSLIVEVGLLGIRD